MNSSIEYSLVFICIGLCLVGFGMIFGFIIVVPAMIEFMHSKYSLTTDQKNKYGDICAALFGVVFQEGGFVIPFVGGILVDAVGFEKMCLLSALIPILFTCVFYVRCCNKDVKGNQGQLEQNGKINSDMKSNDARIKSD